MKLLLIGKTGQLGSSLVKDSISLGHDIIAPTRDEFDISENKLTFKYLIKKYSPQIVINTAAFHNVPQCEIEPVEAFKTNCLAVKNMAEICYNSDIKFVTFSCYDEITRALTTQGLKSYRELKEGDMVFSLNSSNFDIELKHIKKVFIQHYDGPMVHFKNQRIDLLVTPNHNMFILDTTKKLIIESASEAKNRSLFYFPKGNWKGKNEEYFEIGGFWKVDIKDLMYILGIFIGDGFTSYQETEKLTSKGNRTICHGYRIYFDIPTTKKCRKRVEDTLTRMKIFWHPHSGMAGEHIYFSGKEWMEFFDQNCNKGATNKRIPRWALEYSPEILRPLLEGLLGTDGSVDGDIFGTNSRKLYFTSSKGLLSDVSELCIKLGFVPSFTIDKHGDIFIQDWYNYHRKIVPTTDSYYIIVGNTTKSIEAKKKSSIVDYNGDIWCIQVEDNNNFIVERNGKFDFCGNSDYVFDGTKGEPYIESDKACPIQMYGTTKLAGECLSLLYPTTTIIRTCGLYGLHSTSTKDGIGNFVDNRIKDAQKSNKIEVGNDQTVSPTFTDDLSKAVLELIEHSDSNGIYHLINEGFCTWSSFTKSIFNIMNIDCEVIPIDRRGHFGGVRKPLFSALKNDRAFKDYNIRLPHWKDALKRYLELKYKDEANIERI